MYRISASTLAVVASLLLAGGTAYAVPSVVDQYTEQVPTPGGDVLAPAKPAGGGASGSESGNGSVPGDGAAAAATAPGDDGGATGGQSGNGGDKSGSSGSSGEAGGQATSVPSAVIAGTTSSSDGDGMGWLFPALLIGVAGVFAGIAIGRRRGSGPGLTG